MEKSKGMRLAVSKWGNSLAVRLPADSARQIGVGEGDTLVAEVSADGRLILSAEDAPVDRSAVRRLRGFLVRQKVTAPVVAEMRRGARY